MSISVHLVDDPGAEAVLTAGPAHPVLGGLIDLGTTARLRDSDREVTVERVLTLCGELGPGVPVEQHPNPLAAHRRAELEARAAHDPLFVVLVGPVAVVVAAGPELPVMGLMPDCDLDFLAASIRFALGEHVENSLFTEVASDWAAGMERSLDERLLQLYGQ